MEGRPTESSHAARRRTDRLNGAPTDGSATLELVADGDGRVVDALVVSVKPGSRLYGFADQELRGRLVSGLLPHRVAHSLIDALASSTVSPGRIEHRSVPREDEAGPNSVWFTIERTERALHVAWTHGIAELSEPDLRGLVDTLLDSRVTALVLASVDGRIVAASQAFADIAGRSQAELGSMWIRDLVPPDERPASITENIASMDRFDSGAELHIVRPDGSLRTVVGSYTVVRDEHDEARWFLGLYVDMSDRLLLEDSFGHLMELLPEMVFRIRFDQDERASLEYLSPAVLSILGYHPDVVMAHPDPLTYFMHPDDREDAMRVTEGRTATVRFRHADGRWVHLECRARAERVSDDEILVVGVAIDVTAVRHGEEQLKHQAEHDGLTGLANRRMFTSRLEDALATDSRGVAVLFIDLDRFKKVNDSMGHAAGDQLLIEVAERLERSIRPHDLLARFGGDEFTVLLTQLASEVDAVAVAERLRRGLSDMIVIGGRPVSVNCSVGLAFADGNTAPADLLRFADFAMARAKEEGRNVVRVFDDSLHASLIERIELESALRLAADAGEIFPVFQTEHDLATGAIVGAEVLMRWRLPNGDVFQPAQFLSAADEIGLLPELDRQVRLRALREVGRLHEAGLLPEGFVLRMNLSAGDFAESVRPSVWQRMAADAGVPMEMVCLEITEGSLGLEVDELASYVARLRTAGLKVAVDDFGTGYSSLAYLEALPISDVKIDRRFVQRVGVSGPGRSVVRSIVQLCQALGLSVVAEGVELDVERRALVELGVTHGQGYLFGEPVPISALEDVIRRNATSDSLFLD